MRIILQGTPSDVTIDEVKEEIVSIQNVTDIHDCHLWSMDGNYHILTAHVVLNDNYSLKELPPIKSKIFEAVEKYKIKHTTLSFELESEECELENC